MLIVVDTEKLKKKAPFMDAKIANIVMFVQQDIDIIEMLNKDEGLADNITEVKEFLDCLEIWNSEIDQTVEKILELTKTKACLHTHNKP